MYRNRDYRNRDYHNGVETKQLHYSSGMNDLVELILNNSEDKYIMMGNKKRILGSICSMERVVKDLLTWVKDHSIDGVLKEPYVQPFIQYCHNILDETLPRIMEHRIWTPVSTKYYQTIEYAIADLIDCTVVWYNVRNVGNINIKK